MAAEPNQRVGRIEVHAYFVPGLLEDTPDEAAIIESVNAMILEVQKYVPGYTLKNGPVFDGNRVSIYMEVEGLGDFLPNYAGNLDIMTAAGLRTAEMYAEEILNGNFVPVGPDSGVIK